jgi:argininosuccinate synthase
MKIVLAYSGGLDTSVIVPWLRETYDAEVVCFAADVGQAEELEGLEERALASGAAEFHSLDLRRELVEDYILPTLRSGAVYARKYLLGTAMARPLIAAHQVALARRTGADALAHGCTGKGNDQVRFELTYAALAPDLRVIAPWREWSIRSREDALAYAAERGLRLPVAPGKLFSRDRNVWHVSHEGGPLEDPAWEPEESLFLLSVAPERAPDAPEYLEVEFERGFPIAVNGERASALAILERLNALGGQHGVGRVDLVEDRLVGMKSRGVYETPGGTLLHVALRELEQLVLDRRSLALKDQLAARYADLVYEGRWWGAEREALDAVVDSLMARATGRIRLKLYKGGLTVAGRRSESSLYDERLATFGDGGSYRHGDAEGFIRLFALPYAGVAAGRLAAMGAPSPRPATPGADLPAVPAPPARVNGGPPESGADGGPQVAQAAAGTYGAPWPRGANGRSAARANREPAAGDSSDTPTRRMWGARFKRPPAPEFERLNRSLPVDRRLWREDVRASQEWARELADAAVLTREEAELMIQGLERVAARLPGELASNPADEDVHSLVERLLYEEVGELAGKLHTGRSRNDQVATDARLWGMDACRALRADLACLQAALLGLAERQGHLLMPGYTHLRRAQPIRAALWLLSHFWRLERDRARLAAAERSASVLPLGSGALAGCPFPIDRARLAERLGFHEVSMNSLDAVSDRDWACEILFGLALLGVHLSSLAEDLIVFSSEEFGFVRLDERVTSGSSLMPQKRNPDALELARAKAGGWIGDLSGLLAVLKGLPSGYNKDLQEDKTILFRAVEAARELLPPLTLLVKTMEPDAARMATALDEGMLATDIADRLVAGGMPFRESHARVGEMVREGELRGVSLSQVATAEARGRGPGEAESRASGSRSDLFTASADRRESTGGTGREALADQLRQARAALGS